MGRKGKSAKDTREAEKVKKQRARGAAAYCDTERGRERDRKRDVRTEEAQKKEERHRDLTVKQKLRADEMYKQKERENDRSMKQRLRKDEQYKELERERDAQAHALNSLAHATWETLRLEYRKAIQDGPIHVCASCGGLWFLKSLRPVTKKGLIQRGCTEDYANKLLQREDQPGEYKLCKTCLGSAIKKEIPKRHLTNGFAFPELPDFLRNLTQLEQRMVAARIPFMQIRTIGVYLQKGLRGNVVNIENDLDACAKVLPREFNDTATIQVMMMRRMKYKSPYLFETVRPEFVYMAAKYQCDTELYKKEGITLSKEWREQHPGVNAKFIVDKSELQDHAKAKELAASTPSSEDESEDDTLNPGTDERLIMRDDDLVVKFAPGEGKKPMSWLRDIHAEQLSFPSIYGGVPRKFPPKLKISATDIARSEARMFDRRAAVPEHVLYAAKRLQNMHVANRMQIWLRKKKRGQLITAGQLKNEEFVDKLVAHDDGYRWLRKIRLSPAYWEGQQRKVLAMARQLRTPTLFMTLSAAETKWGELLVIRQMVHNGRRISEEEALAMPFHEKATLIRADPVICALYFDHRFRSLLHIILNKKNGAFSPHELQDFFNKIEFAHRGSAHDHGIFWIKNAPTYDRDDHESIQACIKFIDSVITCCRNGDEELEKVIGFQLHKHTHTCKRRTRDGGFRCRFNLPQPVMRVTMILQPMQENEPGYSKAKADYLTIQEKLKCMGRSYTEDTRFEKYLAELNMTEEEYISAIRTSIRRDKIFLKRRTCDIFINAYNEKILKSWKANMDLQFILDQYACVKYCVSSLTKSSSGISKLMRDVEKEIRAGNYTMKEKMRKIANKFINCSEISAQEAAYLVLGLSLTNCSREDTFINTGPPSERVGLLKCSEDLEALHEDSGDIYVPGIVEHYIQRPTELENICLANFASQYTYSKAKTSKAAMELEDKSGYVVLKPNPRIVRYRRYNEEQDPANYMREQIMLYVPWRDEHCDLTNVNLNEIYDSNKAVIETNRKPIDPNHGKKAVEDLVDDVERDLIGLENADLTIQDPDFETDIFEQTGQSRQDKKVQFLVPPKQIPNVHYEQLVRNLNEKQRRYFLHLAHSFNTGQIPFYEFVTGSAGVGKSVCISTIVQFMLRRYATKPGISMESLPVLVCAPTGKAAFNVGGVTVHCAFRLPLTQRTGPIGKLSEDLCNTLRLKFQNLELVIIDEISMLPLHLFFGIDSRLRQIFQTDKPFGGISMLVVGDFFQIRPPGAQFVFETPKNKQFGFIIGNELWSYFCMYELTQIMRQNKALAFAQALNHMARGEMTDEDIALLKSREVSVGLTPPSDAVHLFCTNKECANFNETLHDSLETESAISHAHDTIQGARSDVQEERWAAYLKSLPPAETDGLPTTVRLQVGAEYMISTNVNVPDGIFNGSNGRLESIRYSTNADGTHVPTCAYVKFDSPMVGADARADHDFPENVDHSWTPIKVLTKQMNGVGHHDGITVVRRQIPLLAANGMTVNKSQGSSYHWVVVHITSLMTREKLYVACSRAFTPEGLFIVGEFLPPGRPSDLVLNELRRLQENQVQLRLEFLEDVPNNFHRVMYHNVQSLHRHYPDIITDIGYLAADYVCLLEPWTFSNEEYALPRFIDYQRQDCQGIRSAYGSFVAAKVPITNYNFIHSKSGSQPQHSFTTWNVEDVVLCMVYRYPNASVKTFYHTMEQKLIDSGDQFCIFFGDFNLNIREDQQIVALFEKYGFKFSLPMNTPSTTGGTQLDLVFVNFSEVQAWYYEAIFSYHCPVCIIWPNDKEHTKISIDSLQDALHSLNISPNVADGDCDGTADMDTTEHAEQVDSLSEEYSSGAESSNDSDGAISDEPTGHDENVQVKLPPVTLANAASTHWRVGGFNLSLNELKTLELDLPHHEIEVLARLAQTPRHEFDSRYLTDGIIDTYLQIATNNTRSLAITAAVVQWALHPDPSKRVPLNTEEGGWDQYDNIFIPIHIARHWMLLVVQPRLKRVIFLDPIANSESHPCVQRLLPDVSRILKDQNIKELTLPKTNQTDAFNCGVFLLKYADQLLNNLPDGRHCVSTRTPQPTVAQFGGIFAHAQLTILIMYLQVYCHYYNPRNKPHFK